MLQAGKLSEAFNKIQKYFESIGIDPNRVDYSKRPGFLPDDIAKAWDILDESRATYRRLSGVEYAGD